jgi:mono/diheme cytochrome c family protein
LLVVALLGACSLQRMQEQPRCEPDGTLDGQACNRPTPAGTVAWDTGDEPPPTVTRALVDRGRDRYDRFCAACHGASGDAQTEVNRAMRGKIPSLLAPAIIALPDDKVLDTIALGRGDMPKQPLAPRDRWAVLHYVRVLQQRDVPAQEAGAW